MLEAVEVDEQHREAVAGVPPGVGDRVAHPLEGDRAVGQAGQAVGAGAGMQAVLQPTVLGDVAQASDDAVAVAVHVAQRLGVDEQPAQAPFGQPDADRLPAARLSVGQGLHRRVLIGRQVAAVFAQRVP